MKNKAFTLIEIIVAVAIFSIFIGTATGIFISAISAQRKALATQELLDQTSYVMEYMSRALRMAKKDDIGGVNCLLGDKVNYKITSSGGGGGIKFRNYKDECQEFFWDNNTNQLKELKDGSGNYLTSAQLKVNQFNVNLSGETQTDDLQPRVTILLEIESKRIVAESPPKVKIQATISQRGLDVQK